MATDVATHPYVRTLKGCGHGRLFSEPCVDCEIVSVMAEYKRAVATVDRCRAKLARLGAPEPVALLAGDVA